MSLLSTYLADTPVLAAMLGDASGASSASDSTTNNFSSTMHGTVTFGDPGLPSGGTSALFDGSQWLDFGSHGEFGLSVWTLEIWFKTSETSSPKFLAQGPGGFAYYISDQFPRAGGGASGDVIDFETF